MSHGIQLPIDQVLSTVSAEWHGLANIVQEIGENEVAPFLFPIVSGNVSALVEGVPVNMGNHKALIADFRTCRPDLVDLDCTSNGFVPLHIPKNSYQIIPNADVWEAMKKALRDINATVSCIGTLEGARKFFVSVKLDADNEYTGPNGDKFLANLNFVTSHDGSLGMRAYDSEVRIVCMNTLRASLEAQGEVGFTVYHTSGASLAMANLGDLVNAVLSGRAQFRNDLEYLASVACDSETARLVSLGYLTSLKSEDCKVSTRSRNAADEIALLFTRGQGNNGKSLYDLLNGATEYWTHGTGTGKSATVAEKAYKSNFGMAADHKNAFFNVLMGGADAIAKYREAGVKADTLKIHADTVVS